MDEFAHSGVGHEDNPPGRGSGRYAYGSGENPYQRGTKDFLERVDALKKSGFTTFYDAKKGVTLTGEVALSRAMGFDSVTEYRDVYRIARAVERKEKADLAQKLRDEGKSLPEITRIMGYTHDSSVRTLLNQNTYKNTIAAQETADFLKKRVNEDGLIMIGEGVPESLGVSTTKFNTAVRMLRLEGYEVYNRRVEQKTNPGQYTTVQVLAPKGTEYKEIYNKDIHFAQEEWKSPDHGLTFEKKFVYPESLDSKRLEIVYAEDGGKKKDGVIEIRRGVDDLNLGKSDYAQVRILVDGTHYLKGMAVYSDDLPPGIDVRFNTNKPKGTPALGPKGATVLKPIGNDPSNPFNSLIKSGVNDPDDPVDSGDGGQSYYYDKNGNKKLSLINKRSDEGDWSSWADRLPSQFLSKQSLDLINRQLGLAIAESDEEFSKLNELTNPTIKRVLLNKFADECDSAAVHLQAAALPSQKYHVILPLTTAKDNEIYAPRYKQGQTVALVRYPHAGPFEIPILKVNNNLEEGKRVITPSSPDAVGINSKVAEQLSGADFDGDTVMVIPCNDSNSSIRITSQAPLKALEGFDPHDEYGRRDGETFKRMTKHQTQIEMGKISNLITDMTLLGANDDQIARAVRHSMVVIDAEKHDLNYQKSFKDNRIDELKREWQLHYDDNGKERFGAATLISRAKAETDVPRTKGAAIINPETGEKSYKIAPDSERFYVDKKGKIQERTKKSTQMADTNDAMTLVSDARNPKELAYAEYANHMKALGNSARLAALNAGRLTYSQSAANTYAPEVRHLDAQLTLAIQNKPRERMAQLITNSYMKAVAEDNPDMTKAERTKIATRKLAEARVSVGAQRNPIQISEREWEAIQAGAISDTKLEKIFNNADPDVLRKYATPRDSKTPSRGTINRINSLKNSGYTLEQISEAVGLSVSTVTKYLNK